jgi:hypothetical protein
MSAGVLPLEAFMRLVSGFMLCLGAALIGLIAAPAAQAPQAPAPAPRQGGAGPAPTGPSNLKVLPKTWSNQQINALMRTFNESLGVQCTHCHQENPKAPPPAPGRGPQLDYTLDGKAEKDVARKMIQMVMALNDTTLKDVGDTAIAEKVSCFSCHQGDTSVLAKPAAGWGRGADFSLLPAGPTPPARRGGAPGGAPGNAPGTTPGTP